MADADVERRPPVDVQHHDAQNNLLAADEENANTKFLSTIHEETIEKSTVTFTTSSQAATSSSAHPAHADGHIERAVDHEFEGDHRPARVTDPFARAATTSRDSQGRPTGGLSRLSTAIRRSLRLGPKVRWVPAEKGERRPLKEEDRQYVSFTEFADVRAEPFEEAYGTIAELQHMIQMGQANKVKKFVRHNDWPVSHEIRSDLWKVLCHYKDYEFNKRLYVQQLDDLLKSGVKTLRPAFLSVDGIVVHDHGLKEQGAVTLQRLLIVVECVRPEIRCVPILYPLCAVFLHYMSAEETFACIHRLLTQSHTFLLQSEVAVFASCHTLLALLKKHKTKVYNALKRKAGTNDDAKLAAVFANWSAWVFKHLPFEYLVRVLDCFLVEGHKMLLRVCLSLAYLWYKEKAKDRSTSGASKTPEQRIAEINEQICHIAQNCPVSVQTLLDVGFSIRNFKHSTYERLQKDFENKYREEVVRNRSQKDHAHVRPHRNIFTTAFESSIIDSEAASELISHLPGRFQLETPQLLFRLSEHGASFVQLWTQIDVAEQSLLIMRSTKGRVFGAYCSAAWTERKDVRERSKTRYFGTGESFVWYLHPELQLPVIHPWVGQNSDKPDACPQMFLAAGDRFFVIGSGGGDAISVREELTHGLSYPCETFGSPELHPGNAFEIDELEVFNVISSV